MYTVGIINIISSKSLVSELSKTKKSCFERPGKGVTYFRLPPSQGMMTLWASVADPGHFGTDPDLAPRIRTSD